VEYIIQVDTLCDPTWYLENSPFLVGIYKEKQALPFKISRNVTFSVQYVKFPTAARIPPVSDLPVCCKNPRYIVQVNET